MERLDISDRATPLPASPTEGGGAGWCDRLDRTTNSIDTSPLVGEAGRGVATTTALVLDRGWTWFDLHWIPSIPAPDTGPGSP
jgi:hypothetical protein